MSNLTTRKCSQTTFLNSQLSGSNFLSYENYIQIVGTAHLILLPLQRVNAVKLRKLEIKEIFKIFLRLEKVNEFASNRIPCYAQRTLDRQGANTVASRLKKMYGKKLYLRPFWRKINTSRRNFIADGLREC